MQRHQAAMLRQQTNMAESSRPSKPKYKKKSSSGHHCSAINCTNNSVKRRDLSYFRFPKEEKRCRDWVQRCRREDLIGKPTEHLYKNNYLCRLHFEDSQFMNADAKNKLVWNALPSIFKVPNPQHMSEKKKTVGGGHCCLAINCSNRRLKCPRMSFFRFPKDKERCRIWIQNIRRQDLMREDPSSLHKKGYLLCSNHFEDSQFMNAKEKKKLIWCAVPTVFDTMKCDSSSFVEKRLPTFLQEHGYAQITFIGRSCGKRLYDLRPILPTERMPGKSVITPHHRSRKEPLDRNKQKETEKNEGCRSSKTQSCPKSQRNGKRKLAKKVKSKQKRTKQTENTCIDEQGDTQQKFIIKVERDEDYEDSDINSYQVTETETALQTETVLEKRVKIEPESIPDSSFETDSNSSHRYVLHLAGTVKLEPDSHNPSHGNSSHPTYAAKIEPDNTASSHGYSLCPAGAVKLEPYIDISSYRHSLHLAGAAEFQPDGETADWPGDTCLPAAATEVKTEPCSDTDETPLAFNETSSMAHNLADYSMSEAVRVIVKSEIVSDLDDSEHATTVYVCELCNEYFYSHHQLLIHRRNHAQSSNIKCVGFKSV